MVYGGVQAQYHLFLMSILYVVEYSASRPGCFTPTEWEAVGPTADRHVSGNRKIVLANESGTDLAAGRHCCLSAVSHIISSCTFNQPQYKRSYLHIWGTLNFTAPVPYCSLPVYTAAISPYPIPQTPTFPLSRYRTCLLHNTATHCSRTVQNE
jgi:hypothetical protein